MYPGPDGAVGILGTARALLEARAAGAVPVTAPLARGASGSSTLAADVPIPVGPGGSRGAAAGGAGGTGAGGTGADWPEAVGPGAAGLWGDDPSGAASRSDLPGRCGSRSRAATSSAVLCPAVDADIRDISDTVSDLLP
ncbi:hypothetical protein GCM10009642_50860 [Nocardiopsis metallicus]